MEFLLGTLILLGLMAMIWYFAGCIGFVERSFARSFAASHLFEMLLILVFVFTVYLVYLAVG